MGLIAKAKSFLSGSSLAFHGRLDVPGRLEVDLPSGVVKVYYREEWFLQDTGLRVPKDLRVTLTRSDGTAVQLERGIPRSGGKQSGDQAYCYKKLGQADVAAGRYVVTAEPQVRPEALPSIMVGR
jgi:hypothetical protein